MTIKLLDNDAALAQLGGYVARAQDARGMFENIGMSLVTSTQARFERGQAPDGSPWPPSIRALVTGGKTLIETARLMRSITFQATATSVEVGTNVIYAAIHQLGGVIVRPARQQTLTFKRNKKGQMLRGFRKKGRGNETQTVTIGAGQVHMPARPFLGLDDEDEREIIMIADDWIAGEGAQP
ncbi:phage virion morphogenesis protein [Afipia sp. P52-10]|uniref:phage virion morphogenesis protein n=1 Tax=Afipia sp. P52-10 TaxID=1429916 RepID=UPI0013627500|nr:phage virion morphogenesis protein [Afipia sp. P52-10]